VQMTLAARPIIRRRVKNIRF